MPAAQQVGGMHFNPFSPPALWHNGRLNWTVYTREGSAAAVLLARLSRLRASLIVARQSMAADTGSTSAGRVARSLPVQGFAAMARAEDDLRTVLQVKMQTLDDAADCPDLVNPSQRCLNETVSGAGVAQAKKRAAKRDAAIQSFGSHHDAGMKRLNS
jgi:hypothetical protein